MYDFSHFVPSFLLRISISAHCNKIELQSSAVVSSHGLLKLWNRRPCCNLTEQVSPSGVTDSRARCSVKFKFQSQSYFIHSYFIAACWFITVVTTLACRCVPTAVSSRFRVAIQQTWGYHDSDYDFCNVKLCSLAEVIPTSEERTACIFTYRLVLLFQHEDGGNTFLRNICNLDPRRQRYELLLNYSYLNTKTIKNSPMLHRATMSFLVL
jgi:hypothetical protein